MSKGQWQPGQSGNPSGAGDSPSQLTAPVDETDIISYTDAKKHLVNEVRRMLIEGGNATMIVMKAIEDAIEGDWRARRWLWENAGVLPAEVSAPRGQANVQVNVVFDQPKDVEVVDTEVINID
jgi:hypothetical protein